MRWVDAWLGSSVLPGQVQPGAVHQPVAPTQMGSKMGQPERV
ncbi:hypothetical protein MPTA5024_11095 [Microbispora sp. ATCC PTA-5024]|nr:hypothetical protein MPTA5024_11095 [Microbispora sp. ATCC PTA-5024]